MRVQLLSMLACVVPLVAGCGTMANMAGKRLPAIAPGGLYEPRPFGGVRNDIRWTWNGNLFGVFDLPFSFVGDVVTLPIILLKKLDPRVAPSQTAVAEEAANSPAK